MASVDDIWLVDFGEPYPGEPAARRPALVIGPPDTFGPAFPFVVVVPMSTTHRRLSLHIEIEASAGTGLAETSYIQCELIRSINRKRLVHLLGAVDSTIRDRVTNVVKVLLNH